MNKPITKISSSMVFLMCAILLLLLGNSSISNNNSFAQPTTTTKSSSSTTSINTTAANDPDKSFSTFRLSGIISSMITSKNNNQSSLTNSPRNCILSFSCGLKTTTSNNNPSGGMQAANQQQANINSSASNSISNSSYILAGRWEMDVTNGNVEYFIADFIMGLKDGTNMHVHSIENLKDIVVIPSSGTISGSPFSPGSVPGKITLTSANNYSLSLYGSADISVDGNFQWKDVPITINILNGNVISIFPYPSYTNNHFSGSSIYGVVTLMTDAHYNQIRPSLWTY